MGFYPLFCTVVKTCLRHEGKNIGKGIREEGNKANIWSYEVRNNRRLKNEVNNLYPKSVTDVKN